MDLAFDAAHSNFLHICRSAGLGRDTPKVLALVDSSWRKNPGGWDTLAEVPRRARWNVQPCKDDTSLRATRGRDGATLFIVSGRQIRTSDGLEVLALATRNTFDEGMRLGEAVANVLQCVGFAVIPWGFGKWFGERGRRVEAVLKDTPDARILVGDNSGRASFLPTPRVFRLCERMGIPILPGSDPLPIPGQESKLGRYGFFLVGGFEPNTPGRSLHRALAQLSRQPRIVGTREGVVPFLLSQGLLVPRRVCFKR